MHFKVDLTDVNRPVVHEEPDYDGPIERVGDPEGIYHITADSKEEAIEVALIEMDMEPKPPSLSE